MLLWTVISGRLRTSRSYFYDYERSTARCGPHAGAEKPDVADAIFLAELGQPITQHLLNLLKGGLGFGFG